MPDVTKVTPLGGYRVRLEFEDGVSGDLDLGEFIQFRGVFAPLQQEAEFAKVGLGLGTIVWPARADICPDVLYSRVTGKPIPGVGGEGNGSPRRNA
jgi:hypothetical protein